MKWILLLTTVFMMMLGTSFSSAQDRKSVV